MPLVDGLVHAVFPSIIAVLIVARIQLLVVQGAVGIAKELVSALRIL